MHDIEKNGQFDSSNGISTIHYTIYLPKSHPRAILQVSHGMCEYFKRYEPFADFLMQHGFVVCGNDHLGHGRSAGSLDKLGYFAKKNGADYLVKDLHRMTIIMKKHFPNLPYFLLGHSMGSFIARAYLTSFGKELDGAILCGTSGGEKLNRAGLMMTKAMIAANLERHRSEKLQQLVFGRYNSRYESSVSAFDWLTRDQEVVSRYQDDPYCNFVFTASGFHDLFTLLKRVSSREWAQSVPRRLPILLISGDMDPVGDYGRGVEKVYHRLKKAGVRRVSLKLYENARHEIFNEVNKEEVYEDLLNWCLSVLGC